MDRLPRSVSAVPRWGSKTAFASNTRLHHVQVVRAMAPDRLQPIEASACHSTAGMDALADMRFEWIRER